LELIHKQIDKELEKLNWTKPAGNTV
jgi:hypothetical protein